LNPGIFGTGFCKNPGIPGFSGSGLASISNPGIVLNFSGFFGISFFLCNYWSISLISGVLQVLRLIFTIIIITIIIIVIIIIIIIDITTTIRVFSVAGNTVTQKRVSLAPEKVEICVIVMSNTNLLREIGFRKYRYLTNI